MKSTTLLLALFIFSMVSSAQVIQLKFTALHSGTHVNIDSIRISNLSQACDTVLYWPDTSIILGYVGIPDIGNLETSSFGLKLCSSNPSGSNAYFQLSIPAIGDVTIRVSDVTGKLIQEFSRNLQSGRHYFNYSASFKGVGIITAEFESRVKSLKIIFNEKSEGNNSLEYLGFSGLKIDPKSTTSSTAFSYTIGDNLSFKGWSYGNHVDISASPQNSTNYTFNYSMNFPCSGLAQLTYGGRIYHTMQIGNQCWMKENLNIGNKVYCLSGQFNNGIIEKYCYNNDSNNCNIYGGLYEWQELMQYSTIPGVKGICPSGFHVPQGSEFDTLVNFLSGNAIAGSKMKESGFTHWTSPNTGATNESGFTALGSGYFDEDNYTFGEFNKGTYIWSSTSIGYQATYLHLRYDNTNAVSNVYSIWAGFPVRCVQDCSQAPSQSNAGSDQIDLPDTTTTLAGNIPPNGQIGTWSILSGNGGIISNLNNPGSVFTGIAGQVYGLVWTITNACNTGSKDTVFVSFIPAVIPPCPGIPYFNYGGQTYNTVQIGTQCWMKENLNIGSMINNTLSQTNNAIIEKYCYNNDSAMCAIFGGLYIWNETMQYNTIAGSQGICPSGWHIPTDGEWSTLENFLGGYSIAGGKMKESGFTHWDFPNTGATNQGGFTALGAGLYDPTNLFKELNQGTYYWSSDPVDAYHIFTQSIYYDYPYLNSSQNSKTDSLSARCIKD